MPDNFHKRETPQFILQVKAETLQRCTMMRRTQTDQVIDHMNPLMQILFAIKQGTARHQSAHAMSNQADAGDIRIALNQIFQGIGQTVTIGGNTPSGIVI